MSTPIQFSFPSASLAEANRLSSNLRNHILEFAPELQAKVIRRDGSTQDFGSVVTIILAGPAVVALANGVSAWMQRHHSVDVEIKTKDGSISARNMTADKVAEIIQMHMSSI